MRHWKKIATAAGVLIVLTTLFTVFVLPGIIIRQAESRVLAATGRTLSIGGLSVNPFTWSVRVDRVSLSEPRSTLPFASFSSLRTAVSPASIFRGAPVLREITLVSPAVRIVHTGKNTYNFSDLLPKQKPEPAADSKPARFSLNNITVRNGSIEFEDTTALKTHRVADLQMAVPFVSNIPYLAERYVQPNFSAVINGALFRMGGKLRPFAKSAEYAVSLDLENVDLPFYAGYIPASLPIAVKAGTLRLHGEILHRAVASGTPALTASGSASLSGLALDDTRRAPLVRIALLESGVKSADFISGETAIEKVLVKNPEIFLRRKADGRLDLPLGKKSETAGEPEPAQQKRATRLSVAALAVEGGTVHFDDRFPAGGFSTELRDIAFSLREFTTFDTAKASFSAAFRTARGETFSASGEGGMNPMSAACGIRATDIALESYYPYLAAQLTRPVAGKLDVAADLAWNPEAGLTLDHTMLGLRRLSATYGSGDQARASLLSLEGGRIDLLKREAAFREVRLKDASVQVSRDAAGGLSPLALLRKNGGEPSPPPQSRGAAPAFRWRIERVAGSGVSVVFVDGMKEDRPEFRLQQMSFTLSGLKGPAMGTIPFRVDSRYGDKGRISASGTCLPSPLSVKGRCSLGNIPLTDFDPYVPENLNVLLADGSLDLNVDFDLAQRGEKIDGTFAGAVGVRSFHCLDGDEGEDLLRWESLQLDSVSGTANPVTVTIGDVALNRFFAKVIYNADGTLNLRRVAAAQPASAPVPGPTSSEAPRVVAAAPAPRPAAPRVRIDRVTIQEGSVNFTDRQTKPEYTTKLVNIGGRISGLSSEENRFADLDLRGNLENQSPLRITGRINPLRDDLFVDLKASFTDIELSPVTPYSGTYLGYAVDRGKLYLDLRYLIEKKKLEAENKVFIDQLTFGREIESEKATKLPVRLAVALLKDRKGEIHLDLPVSGRTDDPKFSAWGVVMQMLKNLLVKAATSPFALLQSAFGGKEDFSTVAFDAGTPRPAKGEQEKMTRLAAMLKDRPALKLEVSAFVARERDAEAFRQELLARKMRNEKFLALVRDRKVPEGQTAESLELAPEEVPRYLKAVYLKEKFPKPRNVLGMVKDLPDEEMRKLLLAHMVVGEQELHLLARERSAAVRDFLVAQGGVEKERIFEKSGDIHRPAEKEGAPLPRVEFGVAAP